MYFSYIKSVAVLVEPANIRLVDILKISNFMLMCVKANYLFFCSNGAAPIAVDGLRALATSCATETRRESRGTA